MPSEIEKAIERVRMWGWSAKSDLGLLLDEHDRLKVEIERLTGVLKSLVERLHEVLADKNYQSVWQLAYIHGIRYKGPTYTKELGDAERELTPLPTPREKETDLLPPATGEQLAAQFDAVFGRDLP